MGISGSVNLLQLRRDPGGVTPNTGPNAGVPQNPPIDLLDLLGATGSGSFSAFKSGNANGSQFRAEPAPTTLFVSTNGVTITASGGAGPGSYTYNWTRISGDAGIAISNASAATVNWSKTMSRNTSTSAVWRCTVGDGGVSTPIIIDVNVALQYTTDA